MGGRETCISVGMRVLERESRSVPQVREASGFGG